MSIAQTCQMGIAFDIDEEVVHVESLTGFMVDLPVGVEDGGVETVCIVTYSSVLKVVSKSSSRELGAHDSTYKAWPLTLMSVVLC